jgi:hypothetical protein
MPLNLTSPAAVSEAQAIFGRTPGTSAVALDASAGKATFGFEFPGNIDRLVERLAKKGLAPPSTIGITVPIRNLSGRVIDVPHLIAHLNASPAVSGAAYDGSTVSATVTAATNAMRYVYEEIIVAGLMPVDMPTVAGAQEFVL